VCSGHARSDGLFDIEGRMQDIKADDSDLLCKTVPRGAPIHAMRIVLTIDAQKVIRHVEAHTDAGPTPWCAHINEAYASLAGVTIGAGFMKEVKRRLGGRLGCTHLTELLGPIATTAIQTMMGLETMRHPDRKPAAPGRRAGQPMIDSCYAWRDGGEVVRMVKSRRQASEAEREEADTPGATERA
jgi:hypothetical protein